MNRTEILNTADSLINGEREEQYGSAHSCFKKTAALWSAYLGIKVNEVDVAHMMVQLKQARVVCGSGSDDCFIDQAGYVALAGEIYANGVTRRMEE